MFKESQIVKKLFLALFFLLLSSFVAAQTQEYKDYKVGKGDTLWDISNKELKDPFLWPKVWKENPDIKNPDLIYPGQKIKIPLYLLQKEISPEIKPEIKPVAKPVAKPVIKPIIPEEKPAVITQPPARRYLIDKNLLTVSGYITDSVHSVGMIYDTPAETTMLTKDDFAYIKTSNPVKKGDKFYIIYPVEEVKHPITGRNLGVRIAILGTAELVEEKDPKVRITSSYVEIPVGSLIDNFYEIEPPLTIDNPRKPDVNGYIVTTLRRIYAHGTWDIVFIDKGKNDGLEIGDVLATTLQSSHKIVNGTVQIISTKPSTSAAIVRSAAKEVQIGDRVTGVRQE